MDDEPMSLAEMSEQYKPIPLHQCGRHIIPMQTGDEDGSMCVTGEDTSDYGYHESFTVDTHRYRDRPNAVVSLGSYDGDGGPPNMWWDFTPDEATELAEQLLHNAAVARAFNTTIN
jgi:hypothetical protein